MLGTDLRRYKMNKLSSEERIKISKFAGNLFGKKSYTEVSDKFLSLTSLTKYIHKPFSRGPKSVPNELYPEKKSWFYL